MNTIIEIFGMSPVFPWRTNKAQAIPNPRPSLVYGLEFEIENADGGLRIPGITVTDDGSLRNNGWEYITSPATYSNIVCLTEKLFSELRPEEIRNPDGTYNYRSNYSSRTSIHVHTNVQDLTKEQLLNLCSVYTVFERLLFQFIGDNRNENIYTVPWYDTDIAANLQQRIQVLEHGGIAWEKYTALNLLPIQDKGTVEWRHMAGTNNLPKILTWLRLIGHMYNFACVKSFNEISALFKNLNTTSVYDAAITSIFKDDAKHLMIDNYKALMEEGVITFKSNVIAQNKIQNKIKPVPAPAFNRQEFDVAFRQEVARMRREQQPLRRLGQAVEVVFDDLLDEEQQ